jgi:hypothetical protein
VILPDHLDYNETTDGASEWWPHVFCTIGGCRWTLDTTWDAIGDDGEVDWTVEHPPHPPLTPD